MWIPEYLQIAEQSLILCQLAAERGRAECFAETCNIRDEAALPVFIPDLTIMAAEQFGQCRILTRFVKTNIVGLCQRIEIQEFVIGGDFRFVTAGRNNPLHLGIYGNRPEIAQNGHPLVSFHHIETVQILDRRDRIADPFFQMRCCQSRPFCREFAVLFQQRKEGGRKSLLSGLAACTDNLFDINAHNTQADFMQGAQMRQLFFQHGEVGLFLSGDAGFYFFQADFTGLLIGKISHGFCPFHSIFVGSLYHNSMLTTSRKKIDQNFIFLSKK